jgi:hypothetical protein
MTHPHTFLSWSFDLSTDTGVFTTRQVMDGIKPVLEVYHDHDGDWQFLCGTTLETADLKLVCLGCMVESDPTLGELAEMPPGWFATRLAVGAEWIQEPFEAGDEA